MQFSICKVYNFNTIAPAILGDRIQNVKIRGLIDYEAAKKFINVDLMHRKIYPLMPAGSPDDARSYTYVMYVTESGTIGVLSLGWINEDTIEEVTAVTITVTMPNSSLSDVKKIQDTLNLMGYTGFTIQTS